MSNLITLSLREAIATQSGDYMGAIPTRREFLRNMCEALSVSLDTVIEVSDTPLEHVPDLVELAEGETPRGAIRYGRINYGEIVECIIKASLNKKPSISLKHAEDLRYKGERIEIKALDRFASPSSNNFRTRRTWIVVNSSKFSGIYSTTYDRLIFNSHNHLKVKGFENFELIKAF